MMNWKYIFSIGVMALTIMVVGCRKEPLKPELELNGIHLIEVENLDYVVDAININNNILVTVLDKDDGYQFILLDENFQQVWISTFEEINTPVQDRDLQSIVFDGNNTVSVFWSDGLLRFDTDGNFIDFRNPFSVAIPMFRLNAKRIVITDDGNYLIVGSLNNDIVHRGYSVVLDPNGSIVHSNIAAFSSKGDNILSDVVRTESGEYLVAGLFDSQDPTNKPTSLIIQRLNAGGKAIKVKYVPLSSKASSIPVATINGRGQALVNNHDGTYYYFVNPKLDGSSESNLKCYQINDSAALLNTIPIPLPPLFVSGGTLPYVNKGVSTNSLGNIIGVAREAKDIPYTNRFASNQNGSNLIAPHHSRFFVMDKNGELLKSGDINQEFSNYFNAVVTRADDKTFLCGTQLSFDNNFKLALFELKTP